MISVTLYTLMLLSFDRTRLVRGCSGQPVTERPCLSPLGAHSDLAGPVDVGAVLDGDDRAQALVIVYAVDHAVVAPAGAAQSL
jgi:hypothetical protein